MALVQCVCFIVDSVIWYFRFGFVDFNSEEDAKAAKEAMEDGEIDGNKVTLDWAKPKGEGGFGGRGGGRGGFGGRGGGRGGRGGFGGRGRGGFGGKEDEGLLEHLQWTPRGTCTSEPVQAEERFPHLVPKLS